MGRGPQDIPGTSGTQTSGYPGRKLYASGLFLRRTQEGCGGLGGENPAAFPKARPIFQQPFSLPENAQTLAGRAFRAAGKSVKNFPAASNFAGKPFQRRISDSHRLPQKRKISPKTEVFGRTSLRTSGQKLRSGPPNPGKTSVSARACRADVHEKTSV